MNIFGFIRDKHALVFKIFVYAVSLGIISVLLPSGQTYSVNTLNQLNYWPYPSLYSTSDFYLSKSESEIKEEQKKIKNESPLYFKENTNELKAVLTEFEKAKEKPPLSNYYSEIKQVLDSVYKKGIIERQNIPNTSGKIIVTTGGLTQESNYSDFYTIDQVMILMENLLKDLPNKNEIIQKCSDYLVITVYFDKPFTDKVISEKTGAVSVYKAVVPKGELLVSKNEKIDTDKRELIKSYLLKQGEIKSFPWLQLLGRFIISGMLLGILMLYLAFFRKNIFGQNKQVSFIFLIVIFSVVFSNLAHPFGVLFFWSLPFALIAVLIRIFFDSRTALFTFLITVLFCSFYANDKFQFVFIQLAIGMGTIFSVAEMRRRKELLSSALVVFLFFIAAYVGYNLVMGYTTILTQKVNYLPIIISSLLILLAYPFIFLAEKVFGFVSDFTLMELCDLNSPLLRELSLKVPGTFQHSLQVANLAEEAIFHIGGNALLVRAGAMYHDIGKIENPRYFTENQVGEINPHNEILPEESAKIIIAHVIIGVEKAKANNIPEAVIDFIRTHHGTTTAGFFLNNFKKEHKGEKVSEEGFRYPGPIPFSKETAVLMMADGVEAASRSLKKYDALTISELVDRIIDYKIAENQLINAEITFKDITIVKKIFKKRLMNMYHIRIEYPR